MIPFMSGSDSANDPKESEAHNALTEQKRKLELAQMAIADGEKIAAKSRLLLRTDLLAQAIERSMRRA